MSNQIVVKLRNVMDGNVYNFADDGYGAGSEDKPNGARQRLLATVKKRAPDGLPIFYPVEPLQSWSNKDGATFHAIDLMDRAWTEREDKRLAKFKGEAEAEHAEAVQRVEAGQFTKTSLGVDLTKRADAKAEKIEKAEHKPR